MDRARMIELAVETLTAQKERIELEIAALHKGFGAAVASLAKETPVKKRRKRTAAQHKAQAERMRQYWAARETAASKNESWQEVSPEGRSSILKETSEPELSFRDEEVSLVRRFGSCEPQHRRTRRHPRSRGGVRPGHFLNEGRSMIPSNSGSAASRFFQASSLSR
jgi:hypothetical protein